MSTLQSATADVLCVLASCGCQLTGEHQSSTATQHIVWTQAHGALVSKGGEKGGGCILSFLQARPAGTPHKGDGCEYQSCVCVQCIQKKNTQWEESGCMWGKLICVCVWGGPSWSGRIIIWGGWCACIEEVCILSSLSKKEPLMDFESMRKYPTSEKRAKAKTTPRKNIDEVAVPSLYH